MRARLWAMAAAAACATLVLAACGSAAAPAGGGSSSGSPVKVGYLVPLTGTAAANGQAEQRDSTSASSISARW